MGEEFTKNEDCWVLQNFLNQGHNRFAFRGFRQHTKLFQRSSLSVLFQLTHYFSVHCSSKLFHTHVRPKIVAPFSFFLRGDEKTINFTLDIKSDDCWCLDALQIVINKLNGFSSVYCVCPFHCVAWTLSWPILPRPLFWPVRQIAWQFFFSFFNQILNRRFKKTTRLGVLRFFVSHDISRCSFTWFSRRLYLIFSQQRCFANNDAVFVWTKTPVTATGKLNWILCGCVVFPGRRR